MSSSQFVHKVLQGMAGVNGTMPCTPILFKCTMHCTAQIFVGTIRSTPPKFIGTMCTAHINIVQQSLNGLVCNQFL